MRTVMIRATVVAAALVLLASGSAQAAVQLFAVPFPFIVGGKSLPAGAYRLQQNGPVLQILGEHGNRASLFVMTMPAAGRDPAGNEPALTFERHEQQYRLADVWSSATRGQEVATR